MRIVDACVALLLVQAIGCADGSSVPEQFGPAPPSGFGGSVGAGGDAFIGTGGGFVGVGRYDQPLIVASKPPPPLSGGTLLVFDKGHKAAVADPDRDQVVIVDLDLLKVTSTIPLQSGDEPGRLVQDGAGAVHVVLRNAGVIASIDPIAGTVARRDAVCNYPRGIAYDAASDSLHVACAEGSLITISPKDGHVTRSVDLARDLRDVVVDGDHLLVSRFRSAELLVVDPEGAVVSTIKPPGLTDSVQFAPAVAWRTVAAPGGGALMVHQEEQTDDVQIQPGGYGAGNSGCGGIVRSAVSYLRRDGTGWTKAITSVLTIDIVVPDVDSPTIYLPSSGLRDGVPAGIPGAQLIGLSLPALTSSTPEGGAGGGPAEAPCLPVQTALPGGQGQIVAVAADASGQPVLQMREPFALIVNNQKVSLPGESRKDTGHELFHLATSAGIACASCHPEGREDGHIWKFAGVGLRRTQSISGGILGTEPFHWSGDMTDFLSLAHHVFNERMLGPQLGDDYVAALSKWIDATPAWKQGVGTNPEAVERGRALFNRADVGCATCHAGAKMSNNTTVDVGTGDKFQVPSLRGVVWRAPFMHDGCAKTLSDRFGACGGAKHGKVPTDGTAQADLIAYLETL